MPKFYLVAGPNGAGKTTFAREWLPKRIAWENFLNADMIAAEMCPADPDSVVFSAGRLMLERMAECEAAGLDFATETTLAGLSYVRIINRLREKGYETHLAFVWVREVEFSIARVAHRVRMGGHNIPEVVIRRRFKAGLRNLFNIYRPLVTSWQLYDNAGGELIFVAEEIDGELTIHDATLYQSVLAQAEEDNDLIH
jgi:predicted ABC-type ATPase